MSLYVLFSTFSKYKEVPAILLSGEWLAKCNFNISDHINVEVSDDQLIVKKDYSS